MAKSLDLVASAFPSEPTAKFAARIVVSKENMLLLTGSLDNGRPCVVESADGQVRREAVLWAAHDSLKKGLARVSRAFVEASGLRHSDRCRITAAAADGGGLRDADEVVLEDLAGFADDSAEAWGFFLEAPLDTAENIFPGLAVRDLYHRRTKRSFRVVEVDGRPDSVARFVPGKTRVRILETDVRPEPPATPRSAATPRTPKPALATATLPLRTAAALASPSASPSRRLQARLAQSPAPATPAAAPRPPPKALSIAPVDGLQAAVDDINKFLRRFSPDSANRNLSLSCAAVIEGDKGTGKTMLLDRVAATGWGSVFTIESDDKLSVIQDKLQRAHEQRPSIVIIDNIHELIVEERSNRASVIKTLCKFLDAHVDNGNEAGEAGESGEGKGSDSVDSERVPQLIVLVTCLDYFKDIPVDMRNPGRLVVSVELPFPDPAARRAILRSFDMPLPPSRADDIILRVSHQTHGFNGRDLRRLYELALPLRDDRLRRRQPRSEPVMNGKNGESNAPGRDDDPYLTEDDLMITRTQVVPQSMGRVNIKPRPVYWHDIHGQQALVQALKMRIDMMNRPEVYMRLIKPFPRGFLLYGPPGCSKTMAAQALATESGLNYFSVKGGELLNQYVGETERAVRELFERARRTAPAVIFLDEIDALGGRRADFGDSSASSGRGPQMVPALLSELDGFSPLDKILVVAATNRPEAIDPALLRPGRFDRHFYVSPPDESARRAIIASWAQGMDVSPNLDLDRLARDTDKLSGAEIVGICQRAGSAMAERVFAGQDVTITTDDLLAVVEQTPKSISPLLLQHYERWTPAFK